MLKETLHNNRGVALLVTISVISLLIAVALELNRKARTYVVSTAASRDTLTLQYIAASGIHIGMAILAKDKKMSVVDSIQEDWANPQKIEEVLQDLKFEKGKLSVSITDELGKIQVNALVKGDNGNTFHESQKIMWDRFLRLIIESDESFFDDSDPTAIINSLKDWLESGEDDAISGLNGAESNYYEELENPYTCKNGKMTHLSEFALIKGITPDLFETIGGVSALSRFITVFNEVETQKNSQYGKININTAELPVIAAILPTENEDLSAALVAYRQEMLEEGYAHDLTNPNWYKDIPGFSDITIDPELITVTSDIFRIDAEAELDKMRLTISSVVKREKTKKGNKFYCRVLSWHTL